MITFSFNLAIIFASFLIFLLAYINLNFLRSLFKKRKQEEQLDLFHQNIIFGFIAFFFIIVFEFLIMVISTARIIPINVFYLRAILALICLYAGFLNINIIANKKKFILYISTGWGIIVVPLAYLWLKTNIIEGFNPFIPNYILVHITKGFWIITGIVFSVYTWLKANKTEKDNPIKEAQIKAIVKLFIIFFIIQSLNILGFYLGRLTGFPIIPQIVEYLYVAELFFSIPLVFLIFVIINTDFVSIDFYKNPSLYFRQRIIFKMIISLAIFIIMSLEIVNFATIYIVKKELFAAKTSFFNNKIEQIETEMIKHYDNKRKTISKYLEKFDDSKTIYYLGINLFNDLKNIKGLDKALMLNKKGEPILEITQDKLNFSYSGTKIAEYDSYILSAQQHGYIYTFNNAFKLMELTIAIYDKNNKITHYFLAFFKSDKLFDIVKKYRFSKNGEIQIFTPEYKLIYSTYFVSSFKEELNQGQYFEVFNYNPKLNMTVAVRQPITDAFSGLQKAQYNSFFFTSLSIVIFLFISFFYLKIIEKPIKTLQHGTTIIGEGNLGHEIIIREKNEFYDLAKAFNHMVSQLKTLQKEQLKKEQIMSISSLSVGLNHEINNPIATVMMGSQLLLKIVPKLIEEADPSIKPKLDLINNTAQQIFNESKRVSKILKDIQNINEPIIEDYVDGTKMVKVKFD